MLARRARGQLLQHPSKPFAHRLATWSAHQRDEKGEEEHHRRPGKHTKDESYNHSVYLMRGQMEGVYDDMNEPPIGFQGFAPSLPARGSLFSARQRLKLGGKTLDQPQGFSEADFV